MPHRSTSTRYVGPAGGVGLGELVGPGSGLGVLLAVGDTSVLRGLAASAGCELLAGHLRITNPGADWPEEPLVLGALVARHETTVEPALRRCNHWPGFNLNDTPWPRGMPDAHAAVHREAVDLIAVGEFTDERNPDASLLQVNEPFGYQQWFLFDTAWAAAHPDLARSLLRYAGHWDPLD